MKKNDFHTIRYPWWWRKNISNRLIYDFFSKLYEIQSYLTLTKKFKRFGKNSRIWKLQYLHQPGIMHGLRYIEIGDNVKIRDYTYLTAIKFDDVTPSIVIGDNTTIGMFGHISAIHKIHIGKNVLAADKVYISDNLHQYTDVTRPITEQPVIHKADVYIDDGVWLGEFACVIGAKVGKNSVIGASAVVTRDIPDFSVAVGAPARVIKRYDPETKAWRATKPDGTFL